MSRFDADDSITLADALPGICRVAAETVGVTRVSVWIYGPDREWLECRSLYDVRQGASSPGLRLHRKDYPKYFAALAEWNVIAAGNAHADPRTAEFSPSYLTPLGIGAMLDAAIHSRGEVFGVLCHEQVGHERAWAEDEQTFAVAVAAVVSLAVAAEERRERLAEMRRQRDQLHIAHQALNSHLSNSPLAIIEWDRTMHVTNWSGHAERLFGWTAAEVTGRNAFDWPFVHPDDLAAVRAAVGELGRTVSRNRITNRNCTKTGDVLHCTWYNSVLYDDAGAVVSVLSLIQDDTERIRAEEEQRAARERLVQVQRMETVGRLAGGIAHDFNNLLSVINGTAALALQERAPDATLREDLGEILAAGERAALLTRQLLAYSRQQVLRMEPVNLNDLVLGVRGMLHRVLGQDHVLRLDLSDAQVVVRADRAQLEQVVFNLALNARDAMPDGGSLLICTDRRGDDVVLTVADTGVGMARETKERAFEPFFTTKAAEQGTGLGLAVVYGIITHSGGTVELDSAPGQGCRVVVRLPAAAAATASTAPAAAELQGGSETILLVEDEPAVNALAARILRRAGYTVLTATSGADALDTLRSADGRVDLLLTDVMMPGMSGPELAGLATAAYPRVAVLFTSGYADADVMRSGVNGRNFLNKPYTLEQLTTSVRSVLDQRPARSTAGART